MQVIQLAKAEADIQRLYNYYYEYDPAVAAKFDAELVRTVSHISDLPSLFGEVLPGVRRAVLIKYSLGIFYSVMSDRVVIHTVQSLRQSPETILRHILDSLP
jgi:plasmid stabilization system protein ParE